MAKSYYKYVEREADSFVNWADIGKNMTDMLAETNRVREEKKAAVDESTRDFQSYLNNNTPTGQDESARKEALIHADNASKFMLMQDTLLKSGMMSLKDFTIGRQNIIDDTERLFDTMKTYQAERDVVMQRYNDDISSLGEVLNMEEIEGFGNWEKSGAYINPQTGRVVMAMKDEQIVDGKKIYTMSKNPNTFASILELNRLAKQRWDKFKVAEATEKWTSSLGTNLEEMTVEEADILKKGLVRTTEDITKRTDLSEDKKTVIYRFVDAENKFIKASLSNQFNRASTLLDYVQTASNDKKYFFTKDPDVAKNDPAAILKVINPATQATTFQFSDEQIKASEEYIRGFVRSKYKKSVKEESTPQLKPPPQPRKSASKPASKPKATTGTSFSNF
jgi:hypothetical protein